MRSFVFVLISLFFSSAQLVFSQRGGAGKTIYVSKSGNDLNEGSRLKPYLTISKAAACARPGTRVLIANGTYRESVVLTSGGDSSARIIFAALQKGKVFIKGSDVVRNWVRLNRRVWKAKIGAGHNKEVFYIDGRVFLKKSKYAKSHTLDWTLTEEKGERFLSIDFGEKSPGDYLIERVVRTSGIGVSAKVNYVSLIGIDISQVFTDQASLYGVQQGAITVRDGKGWLIEACTIHDCSSVGIAIGIQGHPYENANFQQPEFGDLTDLNQVGHHVIRNNYIYRCDQAGIFGLLGGSGSEISNNLITDIGGEDDQSGQTAAGIRLAVAIDVQVTHNTIRNIQGLRGTGLFLGPLFQGARVSGNVISGTTGPLICLFKSHGPVLLDNNILVQKGNNGAGIDMLSAEANVFVQNLFYNCSFLNRIETGKAVSTSNYLPHSLVIKQTIPALNIDHRWFSNLFLVRGLDLGPCTGCQVDYNLYANGAHPVKWADKGSTQVSKMIKSLWNENPWGLTLRLDYRELPQMEIPMMNANRFGFFSLSKQFIETPSGAPITIDTDFFGHPRKSTLKVPGPFDRATGLSRSFKLSHY